VSGINKENTEISQITAQTFEKQITLKTWSMDRRAAEYRRIESLRSIFWIDTNWSFDPETGKL